MATPSKRDILTTPVRSIDIKQHDVRPLVDAMADMAFQARNLGRAARIYDAMLADKDCAVIVCMAGSLCSAGLRDVFVDLIEHRMADAVVSTGANLVDQDFFEALGFRHWKGEVRADDDQLRRLAIDRIYDTYIDEDELRICDETVGKIADEMLAAGGPRAVSSREFIREMGAWLERHRPGTRSIVAAAYRADVPVFVPAFSDCSAGFGLVHHQVHHPDGYLALDSAADFRELTQLKLAAGPTGLLMIGGGVPKNFAQDIVVAAEVLGHDVEMHRYAVQITVADERDGALSGSTLREANSWGKVKLGEEQMVFAEATVALPLVAGYAFHKGAWRARTEKRFGRLFAAEVAPKSGE
ncbi:MAG TPA: deoxyhypusine synthase [Gemmatimonadales bacterium]|nr:deoxyhypusine synthase [Gemmatimonadales bacterium]